MKKFSPKAFLPCSSAKFRKLPQEWQNEIAEKMSSVYGDKLLTSTDPATPGQRQSFEDIVQQYADKAQYAEA